MRDEDRPYIEFDRVLNRGLSPRSERKDKDGKITRPAHPGEFRETWRKHLVSHRPPFAPYTWATKEWVASKINKFCRPVGIGNLDKLPANYPAEWRRQLEEAIGSVAGHAEAYAELQKLRDNAQREAETKRAEQGKSDRELGAEIQGAPAKARA